MLKTPILFLIFNRLDTAEQVFAQIRAAQPKALFVAADGPRTSVTGEKEKCDEVRNHILQKIDWPCTVKTLFNNENLGCGKAVSRALSWFFNNVEEGIILEDDCVPASSFFRYCEELLDKYRENEQVFHIAGNNPLGKTSKGKDTYFFSSIPHIWGWATWRRAWRHYSFDIEDLDSFKVQRKIDRAIRERYFQEYWLRIFHYMANHEIDTWDYQWTYAVIRYGGYCIMPTKNLITNIGFGDTATHTLAQDSRYDNQKRFEIDEIVHPKIIELDMRKISRINRLIIGAEPGVVSKIYVKIRKIAKRILKSGKKMIPSEK